MNRLIDVDTLIDALMSYTWRDEDGYEIHDAEEKREYIREWLPSLPTIDAVPVIRCKYCKHYKTPFCKIDFHGTDVILWVAKDDDYCSYGKRKDE